ncbi:hypothetical protein AB1K18_22665 [Peribacillus simplex]|uniref:hypothetical protein n=1 Tax=Peribacillus simplex TaxID=1478 RepID=UPI003B8D559E
MKMELETILDQRYEMGLNPHLAKAIGLQKALMLVHLHSLIEAYGVERDGRDWICQTYEQLQRQIPFWSKGTVKRTILILEKDGCLVSCNYNKWKMNKTKWYSIRYELAIDMCDGTDRTSHYL